MTQSGKIQMAEENRKGFNEMIFLFLLTNPLIRNADQTSIFSDEIVLAFPVDLPRH